MRSQDIDLQIAALKAAGCTNIYYDNGVSGLNIDRPGLSQARAVLQPGDTLTVRDGARISRSVADLIALLAEFRKKGVQVVELNVPENSHPGIDEPLRQFLAHAHVPDMRRPAARQAAGRFLRLVITYAAAGLSRCRGSIASNLPRSSRRT